jgi:hypothetical protein
MAPLLQLHTDYRTLPQQGPIVAFVRYFCPELHEIADKLPSVRGPVSLAFPAAIV